MRTPDKEIKNRLEVIIEYLAENGETHIEDLANYLSVSALTIRRNIKELQDKNIVTLKNNNLNLNSSAQQKWYRLKTADDRSAIQRCAAQFIEPGDICYINTSYTALGILPYVKGRSCTVITNNTNIVNIKRDPLIRAFLTGGEIHQQRSSVVGETAQLMLSRNRANKCFIGVDSVNLEGGLFSNDIYEAAITRQMIESCTGKVYLVVTSDKFRAAAPFYIAHLTGISNIITDKKLDMLTVYELRRNNLDLHLVSENQDT